MRSCGESKDHYSVDPIVIIHYQQPIITIIAQNYPDAATRLPLIGRVTVNIFSCFCSLFFVLPGRSQKSEVVTRHSDTKAYAKVKTENENKREIRTTTSCNSFIYAQR